MLASFPRKRGSSAFTLIEVLIVMVIIGVVVGAISLNLINRKDNGASTISTLNLLRNRMLYAQQQATILNKTLGLGLSNDGYQFMEYIDVPNNAGWRNANERVFTQQHWPRGLILQLGIRNQMPGTLSDGFPDKPQIIFSPNGGVTLFVLYINDHYILASSDANDITIKTK